MFIQYSTLLLSFVVLFACVWIIVLVFPCVCVSGGGATGVSMLNLQSCVPRGSPAVRSAEFVGGNGDSVIHPSFRYSSLVIGS